MKLKISMLVHYLKLTEILLKPIVFGQHRIYLKVFKIIIHLHNPEYNIKFEHLKNLLNVLMVCWKNKNSLYIEVNIQNLFRYILI